MQVPPRWLLDAYARFRDDVKMLVATQDHVEVAYNLYPLQDYTSEQVICGVADWWQAGLLEITDAEVEVRIPFDPDFLPAVLQKPAAQYFVGLTEAGGEEWERIAGPNWDLYVQEGWEFPDGGADVNVFEATSRDRVEHMIAALQSAGKEINVSEGQWSELRPWKPRYWKTLEVGVRFEIEGEMEDPRYRHLHPYWQQDDSYWLERPYCR